MRNMLGLTRGLVAIAGLALASGCSEDPTSADSSSGDRIADAVYALTSNVWDTDGATGYLYTIDSLNQGAPNLDDAIELPGGSWLSGRDGDPSVYVSSGENGPRITRWDVDKLGKCERGRRASLRTARHHQQRLL